MNGLGIVRQRCSLEYSTEYTAQSTEHSTHPLGLLAQLMCKNSSKNSYNFTQRSWWKGNVQYSGSRSKYTEKASAPKNWVMKSVTMKKKCAHCKQKRCFICYKLMQIPKKMFAKSRWRQKAKNKIGNQYVKMEKSFDSLFAFESRYWNTFIVFFFAPFRKNKIDSTTVWYIFFLSFFFFPFFGDI